MIKVDYEKLYQMRSEIHKLLKDRKSLDVEDLPIETFNPAEGFSELGSLSTSVGETITH
ncbi:hypothetical protein JGZ11_06735 [Staphylococcus pseudintermedius]|uniref:hypothetical protein n=1 Tax=Staphylococcus pseudintermedius TaxID=283734 RepID=UPI0018EF36F5|nr:hypothetical protein [Staphylococcus pseudintermedius]QQJ52327.1 hypothetical protein JGZ11_06735 [Staphylococcus pseudintermedius]